MDQPRALERYSLYVIRDYATIIVASSVSRRQVRSIVRAFPLDTWYLVCEDNEGVQGDTATILRRLANGPSK